MTPRQDASRSMIQQGPECFIAFLTSGQSFRKSFADDERVLKAIVSWFCASVAGHSHEPQFAVARLAADELQHRVRVGACQPFRFGHGLIPLSLRMGVSSRLRFSPRI